MKKPAGWNLFNRDEVYEDETLWTAARFGGRPVGLKFRSSGSLARPRIQVTIFTRGRVQKQEISALRSRLKVLIGAHDDLKEFYSVAKTDPILRHTVKDLYGMHDTHPFSIFDSVVLSICLQMTSLKRADQMMEAIDNLYGDRLEFDGKLVTLSPSPERIAALDAREFSRRGNLGYRGKYIVASAKKIVSGFPEAEELAAMAPETAKEKIMELPGIGDYSADIVNPHGGFPIDAWSVHVFSVLLFGRDPKNSRNAIERVKRAGVKRWGRWSWMAFFYVAQDLQSLSKRLGVRLRLS